MRSFLALVLLTGSLSFAGTITYVNPAVPSIQQTGNNPCVIGSASCNNPSGFAYTTVPGGAWTSDYSPYYTVQQLLDIIHNPAFALGLDLNGEGNTTQIVTRVAMFKNTANNNPAGDVLVDDWAGTLETLPLGNNGNGYSDVLFKTFSLSGLPTTTYIRFYLEMSKENGGAETLFLLGRDGNIITTNGDVVPEPSTGLMLSSALLGLGAWARRRRK